MVENLWVRVPAGAVGEFSSPTTKTQNSVNFPYPPKPPAPLCPHPMEKKLYFQRKQKQEHTHTNIQKQNPTPSCIGKVPFHFLQFLSLLAWFEKKINLFHHDTHHYPSSTLKKLHPPTPPTHIERKKTRKKNTTPRTITIRPTHQLQANV